MRINKIGNYIIYRNGTIKNANTGRILKKELTHRGYERVTLSMNGKIKRYSVHRLLAMLYLPNPENKQYINHINGDKTDNRLENLEWCTLSENMLHAYHVLKVGYYKSNEERKRKVRLIKDNWYFDFDSMAEASHYILDLFDKDINRKNTKNMVSMIGDVCKGRRKTFYGYKAKWI